MNCSDARHLIHLDAGNDLRSDEERVLAGHMDVCAECRAYHAGMAGAMNALMVLRDHSSEAEDGSSGRSVWPAVSRAMRNQRSQAASVRKFNIQVVALSVCSLSLAVVTIVQSLSSMRSSLESTDFVPAQTVSIQTPLQFRQPGTSQAPSGTRVVLPGSGHRSQSF